MIAENNTRTVYALYKIPKIGFLIIKLGEYEYSSTYVP